MVIFTILSKTDGGPLECVLVDVTKAGADAIARPGCEIIPLAVEMAERAERRAEEVNMAL